MIIDKRGEAIGMLAEVQGTTSMIWYIHACSPHHSQLWVDNVSS